MARVSLASRVLAKRAGEGGSISAFSSPSAFCLLRRLLRCTRLVARARGGVASGAIGGPGEDVQRRKDGKDVQDTARARHKRRRRITAPRDGEPDSSARPANVIPVSLLAWPCIACACTSARVGSPQALAEGRVGSGEISSALQCSGEDLERKCRLAQVAAGLICWADGAAAIVHSSVVPPLVQPSGARSCLAGQFTIAAALPPPAA
ncbi:hypothetical protein ANO11243_034200 [Dothideomycetidae sp. 11243]|nr:hypothetical protein ANO11243_034200 [fungal sp. No.11243]